MRYGVTLIDRSKLLHKISAGRRYKIRV